MPRLMKALPIVGAVVFLTSLMWVTFLYFILKQHSHLKEQYKSLVHQMYKDNNVDHKHVWTTCADEYHMDQFFRIAGDGNSLEDKCFCPCKTKQLVLEPLRSLYKRLVNNDCFYVAYDDQFVICHQQWYFQTRKPPIKLQGEAGAALGLDFQAMLLKNNTLCQCKCDEAEKDSYVKPKLQKIFSSCLGIGKTSYLCLESRIYNVYTMADDIEHNQFCTKIIPQAVWNEVVAIHNNRMDPPDYNDLTTPNNDEDQDIVTDQSDIDSSLTNEEEDRYYFEENDQYNVTDQSDIDSSLTSEEEDRYYLEENDQYIGTDQTDIDSSLTSEDEDRYYLEENEEPRKKRSTNGPVKTELKKYSMPKRIPKWLAKHSRVFWLEDNVNELAKIASMIQLRMSVIDSVIRFNKNDPKSQMTQEGYRRGRVISSPILPIVINDICKFKKLVNEAVAKLGKGGPTRISRDRMRFIVLGLPKTRAYSISEMAKKTSSTIYVNSSMPTGLRDEFRIVLDKIVAKEEQKVSKEGSPKGFTGRKSRSAPKWLRKTYLHYWKLKEQNLVNLHKMWSQLVTKLASILKNLKKCKTT